VKKLNQKPGLCSTPQIIFRVAPVTEESALGLFSKYKAPKYAKIIASLKSIISLSGIMSWPLK
jgi:hypothetical protein